MDSRRAVPGLTQHLFHLVFQMQLHFFETLLLRLLFLREKGFRFQVRYQPLVHAVLIHKLRNSSLVCIRCALTLLVRSVPLLGMSP